MIVMRKRRNKPFVLAGLIFRLLKDECCLTYILIDFSRLREITERMCGNKKGPPFGEPLQSDQTKI